MFQKGWGGSFWVKLGEGLFPVSEAHSELPSVIYAYLLLSFLWEKGKCGGGSGSLVVQWSLAKSYKVLKVVYPRKLDILVNLGTGF